jgi:hypothetical protein
MSALLIGSARCSTDAQDLTAPSATRWADWGLGGGADLRRPRPDRHQPGTARVA